MKTMSDKLIFESTSGLPPLPDRVSTCITTVDKRLQAYKFAISVEAGGITSGCAFVMAGEQAETLKQAISFLTHEALRRNKA